MRKIKILNFGSCNIDYVYSLDHIVNVGETETTYGLKIFPGGKGLNQSIAVARAGAEIYHAGCVGSDGAMLTDILEESGVDISYLKKVDAKSGHAIIQVSAKGENSIFIYPGSNEMVTKELIDFVLEKFSADDILLLQNEISNVDYIIEKAYRKKMCIVLNPSPLNEKIRQIDFNMISYIILNKIEAREISACSDAEENIMFFKTNYPNIKVILTLGSSGCIYTDSTLELYQPAYKVEVADTTAAGDTFTGYFVAELSKGKDYAQILKIASAAAAISVTRNGAAPSIPFKNEVTNTLKDFKLSKQSFKDDIICERIERYIEQNIRTVNLDKISKELGYSAVYTGSLIKKLTGQSFSKLLQNKRCSVAAQKLLHTDLSVEEIISAVGYENESFFRKIFREKYGKNPLEFRKKIVRVTDK